MPSASISAAPQSMPLAARRPSPRARSHELRELRVDVEVRRACASCASATSLEHVARRRRSRRSSRRRPRPRPFHRPPNADLLARREVARVAVRVVEQLARTRSCAASASCVGHDALARCSRSRVQLAAASGARRSRWYITGCVKRRLVDLVVAVAAVAPQVDHHVALELLAERDRQLAPRARRPRGRRRSRGRSAPGSILATSVG